LAIGRESVTRYGGPNFRLRVSSSSVATPGALAALKKAGQQPGEFLTRHVNREWGDLSDEDRKENDYSLEHGFRLLSAYRTHPGDKLWIITESDRSVTTLLLPEEY